VLHAWHRAQGSARTGCGRLWVVGALPPDAVQVWSSELPPRLAVNTVPSLQRLLVPAVSVGSFTAALGGRAPCGRVNAVSGHPILPRPAGPHPSHHPSAIFSSYDGLSYWLVG